MATDNYTEAEAEALAKFQKIREANRTKPSFEGLLEETKAWCKFEEAAPDYCPSNLNCGRVRAAEALLEHHGDLQNVFSVMFLGPDDGAYRVGFVRAIVKAQEYGLL
jgi:hypothetical protein